MLCLEPQCIIYSTLPDFMMEEEEAIEKRPKKKTTHTPHNIVLIICIAAYSALI